MASIPDQPDTMTQGQYRPVQGDAMTQGQVQDQGQGHDQDHDSVTQVQSQPNLAPAPTEQAYIASGGLTALVFGASGITGYALMSTLLEYPHPQTFTRVIGLTHRPLDREVALLPPDGRLELFSGMNLLHREQSLAQLQAIPGIENVTHVYFVAYTGHGSSYQELRQVNEMILVNAVGGIEICCPKLEFFTLQTGGKAYGVEFRDNVPYNPPHQESAPRIPEPYAQNIFYYSQRDIMMRASANKPWQFCEIRPDAIIGFVPQGNAMNIAQALGLFLSLWIHVEGVHAVVPFPGTREAWTALHTDTSQDVLARFHVFASLNPERVAGEAFNVADGDAVTWEAVWPKLCAWFGLTGGGPLGGSEHFDAKLWVERYQGEWEGWAKRNGLVPGIIGESGWSFMQAVISIPFRRDYNLGRSREVGFLEQRPHWEGYYRTFEKMREAKLIP